MPLNYKPRNPRPAVHVIGPSIAYIELTRGLFSLVDKEDADWLSQWNWHARPRHQTFYAWRHHRAENGNTFQMGMHRAILNIPVGVWPDHINGNGLDNRRSANLRVVTHQQNAMNLALYKSNSLGVKGVHKIKDANRYRATVYANKVRYDLGLFKTIEEASAAYQAAAKIHFGEFARR
jgi:hypothetical protein